MIARATWVSLAVAVLVITFLNFDQATNPDISIFLLYAMLVLSFPSGLALAAVLSFGTIAAHSLLGIEIGSTLWSIGAMWLAFLLVGYWQWFALVPYLRKQLRKLRQAPGG